MTTLSVHTRSRAYDIFVGDGLLRQAGPLCREVNPRGARALIVTDSNVYPLFAGQVARSLESAGYAVSVFAFPAGEEQKRLDTIARIYAKLAEENLTRSDLLVALGGGVTGDMTGFAAATWLRGVDFVQIPTSLLAQVDSSVGGKTGVDIPQGKNLVGAFRQPARVLADLSVLDSLPPSFLTDGMAEIIKAGCILDKELFAALEAGDALSPARREATVVRAIAIKQGVVERDETETGERKLLNFGHTLGPRAGNLLPLHRPDPRPGRRPGHGGHHRRLRTDGPHRPRHPGSPAACAGGLRPAGKRPGGPSRLSSRCGHG